MACVGLGGSGDTKIRMMTALREEVSNSFSRIAKWRSERESVKNESYISDLNLYGWQYHIHSEETLKDRFELKVSLAHASI